MVLIDKRNPILTFKPELRLLMAKRREVHMMFDMIKCGAWETLISKFKYKFLVLRDSYLTHELIGKPALLEKQIKKLWHLLKTHLRECKVSWS